MALAVLEYFWMTEKAVWSSKDGGNMVWARRSRNILMEVSLFHDGSRGSNRRSDGVEDDWDDDDGGDKRGLLSANSANPVTADEMEA